MTTPAFISKAVKSFRAHSPEVLTGFGIVGVATTAYLTGKASFKAARVIDEDEARGGISDDPKQRFKEQTKLVWKFYIPAATTGAVTVACIFGAQRATSRRTAAAVTAYTIAERTFSEYRDKVVEQIGKGPEQKVRDSIAQDRVEAKPVSSEIMFIGTGHVLCCELFTHRYFRSDMETLKKAQNEINQKILSDLYVMLSEFYDLIGLPHTSHSDYVGWDSGKELELLFSAVLSEGGEPCMAFDYNYTKPL